MAKPFSGCEFVWASNAAPCSFSVRIATADSAIAVLCVAIKLGFISGVPPIAGINRVWKAGWIIATASVNTVSAKPAIA